MTAPFAYAGDPGSHALARRLIETALTVQPGDDTTAATAGDRFEALLEPVDAPDLRILAMWQAFIVSKALQRLEQQFPGGLSAHQWLDVLDSTVIWAAAMTDPDSAAT